ITARALGRTTWSVTRTVKPEDDTETIEVPKLAEANPSVATAPPSGPVKPVAVAIKPPEPVAPPHAAEPHAVPPPAAAAATAEPPDTKALTERDNTPVPETPGPSHSSYTPAIIVGAGAVVLGGVSAWFYYAAHDEYGHAVATNNIAAKNDAPNSPQQVADVGRANQQRDTANTRIYTGDVFVGAAGVAAAVSVYLYIRARDGRRAETTAIAPVAGPQLTGLAVVGHW
ncbi:MAG TPA: hypothetical protein VH165_22420, partial [Kofleriaceae bacterium]|nr:hypothetical protein [Kofleriaceae bacterium]